MNSTQTRRFLLPALLLCTTICSSCTTPLQRAAEKGKIEAVRREIAYANTLSPQKRERYLDGSPNRANLVWHVPAGILAMCGDGVLMYATLFTYPFLVDEPYFMSKALNYWEPAMQKAYKNDHHDVVYELMKAGAPTPKHISRWMYSNYWRYYGYSPQPQREPKPGRDKTGY